MKRKLIARLCFIPIIIMLNSYTSLKADEGMWLLNLLEKNYEDMQKQGLKLSQDDIYSINKSSLKDAIVIFGGYCTGEIVSDQGLLFINHQDTSLIIGILKNEKIVEYRLTRYMKFQ